MKLSEYIEDILKSGDPNKIAEFMANFGKMSNSEKEAVVYILLGIALETRLLKT